MKASLALVAALGLALPLLPAAAQEPSVTVAYEDLDLTSPEGQAQLDRRIEKAARQVCGADEVVTGTRIRDGRLRNCVSEVKQQVKDSLASLVGDQGERG